jgi:3-phosphoshikimate 1-carboxyvinyltransferase
MPRVSGDITLVHPGSRATGRVRVPGDKSISHRYAMLAALADGVSRIDGYLTGADCAATLACLRALGVAMSGTGSTVEIEGLGVGGLRPSAAPLDAANSGTTLRLLSGIAAGHPFHTVIGGDASLSRRPMRRIIEPLTRMGAAIESRDGRPPLVITGARLRGIHHRPEVPSAQVKSCVLLAGLLAEGETTVTETVPTRDHTERALEAFGARVARDGLSVRISGGQRLRARPLAVPGDVSSAVFWLALAGGTPGSEIVIEDVGLNPTRTAVLDVFRRAGAIVEASRPESDAAGEPAGSIRTAFGGCRSFVVTPDEVPLMIDEIPALAAFAALMPEGCTMTVRGAAELRVKESDRISTLAAGFRTLGAAVEEFPDGFTLTARTLAGGTVDPAGDHRVAMAFAIAATGASGPTTIVGAPAVDVSYPGFFADLERLTRSGEDR